jgi:hypothetical protein
MADLGITRRPNTHGFARLFHRLVKVIQKRGEPELIDNEFTELISEPSDVMTTALFVHRYGQALLRCAISYRQDHVADTIIYFLEDDGLYDRLKDKQGRSLMSYSKESGESISDILFAFAEDRQPSRVKLPQELIDAIMRLIGCNTEE